MQNPNENYNLEAQTFALEISTDELAPTRVFHKFGKLTDKALIAFDERRSIEYATAGKETDVEIRSAAASLGLWDDLILEVEGYGAPGEPLPENWRELVPADEKIQVIEDLLFCEIREDDAAILGNLNRSWAALAETRKTIRLRAFCDGREVFCSHVLGAKTAAHVLAYDKLRAGVRLGKKAMTLKPQMKAKGELYDRMIVEVEGYAGGVLGVPLHHKATVITALFESSAVGQKK